MTTAVTTLPRSRLAPQVRDLFGAPSRPVSRMGPGSVGVELEFIPVRPGACSPEPVRKTAIEKALAYDPTLVSDASITFEPGGQVELSPPPSDTVVDLFANIEHLVGRLRRCVARSGIVMVSTGTNMWHSNETLGLQTNRTRYRTMQAHFDQVGPYGRKMMRQTAALHVCLDFGEGEVAGARWLLANLAGPALTAAFANSSVFEGAATGYRSTRSAIWQEVDPSRTGFAGEQIGSDPIDAYCTFALAAEVMPLPREDGETLPVRMSFGDWWALDGARPDGDDLAHHFSTLFPPVRPHGYMEVRYIDALPEHWIPIPVLILTALLYDQKACGEALAGLSHFSRVLREQWRAACALGVAEAALRSQALMLFDLAFDALPRFSAGYFPTDAASRIAEYRERYVESARCPADDQLQHFSTSPDHLAAFL